MTRLGLVALVILAAVGGAYGAELRGVSAGSRVRVSSPSVADGAVIGTLAAVESDAIVIRPRSGDPPLRVPFGADTKVELSVGRRSKWARGAMMGAAIGAAPGLLLTFGDYSGDVSGDGPSPAAVAAMGAAGGALVGAAVGWALKSDEWQEVHLSTAGVGLIPRRGGIAVSVWVGWGANRSNGRQRGQAWGRRRKVRRGPAPSVVDADRSGALDGHRGSEPRGVAQDARASGTGCGDGRHSG